MSATGRRALRKSEQGTIAIEFVLLAPILLVLVFGIVEFGRAYNAKVELTSAVREGARALALGSDDPETATIAAAPSLDDTVIVVSTSAEPCTPGSPATVTASYPFTLHIPFWGTPTLNLQAEGVMRCGG